MRRALPVFTVAFAVIYVLCMYNNLALMSYFPRTRTWYWLTVTGLPARNGPGMYWYGWLATTALASAALAGLSLLVPDRAIQRAGTLGSWIVPAGAMVVLLVLLRGWFIS